MYDEDIEDIGDIVNTVVRINKVINGKLLKFKTYFYDVIDEVHMPHYVVTKHKSTQLSVEVKGTNKFGDEINKKFIITPQDLDYLDEIQ
jgi:hypothetical protein